MLYSVDEISIKANVSKVTIYNKLKLKELKPHIVKKQGKSFVDEEGFKLISDSLNLKSSVKNQIKNDDITNAVNEEIATDSDDSINLKESLINALNSDIEFLRQEIQEKNNQIKDLNNRLEEAHELTKNMQVLQLKQQPQDILQLEEHVKEFDGKLCSIKEEMEKRRQQEENKGLLARLFKK